MLECIDGPILYHGSYCEVSQPQLEKCARRKDFGKGFYLTTSKEQAISFLKTSIAKAVANGNLEESQDFGYLSTFELKLKNELAVHIFEEANVEWLHCIAAHRKRRLFIGIENEMSKYDVIVGKIADDFCIRQLLPNKLKDQYCFKTSKAIDCLHFVESDKIWLKK